MPTLTLPEPYDFARSTERYRAFGPDLANLWHEGGVHRVFDGREVRIEAARGGVDVEPLEPRVHHYLGGPFDLDGHPLRMRLDVGRFEADEPVVARETDWGVDSDFAVDLEWNESLAFQVKFAWLASSDLLEAFTPKEENDGLMFLATADLRF